MPITTIPKLFALIVLLAAIGAGALTWFAALPTPTAQAQTITDYDANDNGLIDISSIAQLSAMRHDLDGNGVTAAAAYDTAFPDRETSATGTMGCPAGACAGYELTTGLTFGATSTWAPINNFNTTLDGAGYTITGLNVSVSASVDAGMFRYLAGSARIRDLGLLNASVTSTVNSNRSNGILAGSTAAGAVLTNVYASGGRIVVGGLAGTNVGGLVGYLRGSIYASYTTAAVTLSGSLGSRDAGGLAGRCDGCAISTSYAAGAVTVPGAVTAPGGLVGDVSGAGSVVTNSYCDTQATGRTSCVGASAITAITTADFLANTAGLQTPTGYTGIYLNWNLDTDGDGLPNYPWNFGTSTTYPVLNTPAQRAAATPAPVNYDADGDNLISIFNLAQLSALRWDPDGSGRPATNTPAYSTVFAGHTAGMGCDPACAGYELAADLTFPAATSSPHNPWPPIPSYNGLLDGNGRALTDLRVEHDGPAAGLFAFLSGSSTAINLDLVNPSVTTTRIGGGAGALAGTIAPGATVDSIAVRGGRIASAPSAGAGYAGGLAGRVQDGAHVRNSYSGAVIATTRDSFAFLGGLVGNLTGQLTNTYAYGPIIEPAGTTTNYLGGLVGLLGLGHPGDNSYCDSQASMQANCVGVVTDPNASPIPTAVAKTTAELQTPTDYTGIYEGWTPGRWNFGTTTTYPTLTFAADLSALTQSPDSPPPGGPRQAQPPQDTPYDPAADHPEIYENPRYEMSAKCDVQRNADGDPESSQITFNLGNYQGAVILHLAIWNGEFFMSYESQGIPMPPFERNGQTATVRVTTDPAQTRFLLDSVSPTTNLVLGYADCHTDDPGATESAPAAAAAATTSTAATPAAPKVYANERYEMTASCDVQRNADGEPDGATIRFNLGTYEGAVILHLSLWNGEYYASYESLGIDTPPLERDGQSATVRVATNPAQTRFLLDSVAPTSNLVLGYADCHTAGG